MRSACSRCSRTCCRTRSSSRITAACRSTIEPVASRLESATTRRSTARPTVIAFSVTRYRHRHSAGQAADHLRSVPAGRRQHEPQVRRHRPGPGDQPRTGATAGRRDPAGQHAGQGSTFTLYLPLTYMPPRSLRKQVVERALPIRRRVRGAGHRGASGRALSMRRLCTDCRTASCDARADEPSPIRIVNEVGDDRDVRSAGRSRAADRRERSRRSRASCSTRRASKASRAS